MFDIYKVMFKVKLISVDVFAYCDVELVGEAVLASLKASCSLDVATMLVDSSSELVISNSVLAISEGLIVLDVYFCGISEMNGKRVNL